MINTYENFEFLQEMRISGSKGGGTKRESGADIITDPNFISRKMY